MLRVAGWLVVGLAAIAAFGALYGALPLPEPNELVSSSIAYAVLYGCVAFLARRHFGFSWADLMPIRGVAAWLLVPVLVASLGGLVLSCQALAFCRAMNVLPPEVLALASGSAQSAGPPNGSSLLYDLVTTSLLPGIAEEALLRGLVLQALLAKPMSERRAIVVSAFLFAAIHFNLEMFAGVFLGGLLYGWMFVRTGSLLPSMVAHAFHNALCVLLTRMDSVPKSIYEKIAPDSDGLLPAWFVWIGVALTAIGALAFRRALRREDPAARARREMSGEPLDLAA